jgi:hypothetical protein
MITFRSAFSQRIFIAPAVMIAVALIMTLVEKTWIGALFAFLVVSGWLSLYKALSYTITENTLIIRWGLFYRRTIDIRKITKLRKSSNSVTAPALSLNRIGILFGVGAVLISPQNRETFIKKLREINPRIEFEPSLVP